MANSDVLVRMKADTKNYDANIAKARRQLDQFKKDNLSLGGVLKQSTSALTGMAAQFMSVYAAIGAAKKVMGDMVRINMQFEQGTSVLASVIGRTKDEITSLTNQAKQLGATTRYTASQITELQTNLARLGFTETEILNSTKAVQALATATGAELGEAANLAGAALRGFGMNASEMDRVASVLAVSTTKSALSFEKLAVAIPIVSPVAKQFGFTIEDVVTLLGKLSDAGFDASSAATATRNIFLNLANSSGKLATALGRPVTNVAEFGEALDSLRKRGIDLAKMLELTDKRSVAAFATFVDNANTLKEFKDSITDCSDALGDMESKQINTLQGSITILNSAWEGLMLSFSESNGVIKTVTDSLTKLLTAWTNWRNRNAGGDAAIQTYELGVTSGQKTSADQIVGGYRAGGATDEQIAENINKTKLKLQEEEAELRKVYDLWEKRYNLIKSGKSGLANGSEFALLREMGLSNTTDVRDQLAQQIAGLRDQQAVQDYMLSLVTPAPVVAAPKPSSAPAAAAKKGKATKTQDIPVFGSLGDWEAQAKSVREYMQGATSTEEYKELEADLEFILGKIKEIKGETEVVFAPGSLNDLNKQLADAKELLAGLTPDTEAWAAALQDVAAKQAAVQALQAKMGIGVQNTTDDAKDMHKAFSAAASAVATVGGALQQIEDPAAKVAGIIAAAIAQVALTFASSLKGTIGPWDWIAAATAGIATMISTITAIKSVTSAGKFAEGGIVGGNNYNDGLVANVSSGELILNRAQQDSIAAQLSSANPFGNLQLTTRLSGTELLILLNNTNRSMGGSRSFYTERH